jgi:hypothetical protein
MSRRLPNRDHPNFKKSSPHVFKQFDTLMAMLPARPCYSEIE